ncbi:MAG TPA: carboxypeptidase-like regulatory domain-containing protein, partial [Thermoanaerobaculia bacterium]
MIPGLFAAFLAAGSSTAQTTGAIAGRATDTSGGAVPGASVEATSASLQGTRAATTGAYGEFRLAALPPGSYQVLARLAGFRNAQAVVQVGLDATATIHLILQPSAKEDVVVHGEVPFVDTSSTMSATSYTSRVISHLPCDRD